MSSCTKSFAVTACALEELARPGQAREVTNTHQTGKTALIPVERIERTIVRLRGHNVMLDADLAALYGVDTRELVQAVRRNVERFPKDFMFQLRQEELESLRSQSVISNSGRGGRRTAPYAFTEQGVAMLSSVLRSPRAVQLNIGIMRAFVRLRQMLQSNAETREEARRARGEVRRAVHDRVQGDPKAHGASGGVAEEADRVPAGEVVIMMPRVVVSCDMKPSRGS